MFPLLSLPNDLVHPIIEAIDDRFTLISLAQTCSKLQPLAEAQLFRSIVISNGAQAPLFTEVLNSAPLRYSYVQCLDVTPTNRTPSCGWQAVQLMPNVVEKMARLKELRVESPLINGNYGRWWGEGTSMAWIDLIGRAGDSSLTVAPLPNLTSFTFHSHGSRERYYPIQAIFPLLGSPILKYLHLSCVKIEDFEHLHSQYSSAKTPLKTLILEECDFDLQGLASLLSLPKALTSLSIGETQHHRNYGSRLNLDIRTFLAALSQQSESLQHLQHTCCGFHSSRPAGSIATIGAYKDLETYSSTMYDSTGMSQFRQLKTLKLDCFSILTQLLPHSSLAPPALEKYCLIGLAYEYEGHWKHISERLSAVASATSFQQLELHTEPGNVGYNELSQLFMLAARVNALVKTARIMKERNTTTMLVSYSRNRGYIPPFLYGEPRWEAKVCFESERFWALEKWYEKMVTEGTVEDSEKERAAGRGPTCDDGTVLAAQISAGYIDRR